MVAKGQPYRRPKTQAARSAESCLAYAANFGYRLAHEKPLTLWHLHSRQPLRRFLGRLRLWFMEFRAHRPYRWLSGGHCWAVGPPANSRSRSYQSNRVGSCAGIISILRAIAIDPIIQIRDE